MIMVKVDFEVTRNGHTFRDAIVLPDDHNMTNDQIETMKQARFEAWFAMVTAASDAPEE